MILVPNLVVALLAILSIRKHWAFLLVVIGAVINIAVPYWNMAVFNRSNGLNAPGVPDWCVWALAAVWTNQGTLILILGLLTCSLVSNNKRKRQIVEPKDRQVFSESAPSASSEKPSS
jgi:hypothetical protein